MIPSLHATQPWVLALFSKPSKLQIVQDLTKTTGIGIYIILHLQTVTLQRVHRAFAGILVSARHPMSRYMPDM